LAARRPGGSVGLPGYAYDERLHNYVRVSTGKMVPRREISDLLRSVVDESGQAMREFGRLAARGEISPREFYEAMQLTVRQAYNASAALGKGGWAQMTPADWGRNGYNLRLEYERLREFARAIEAGERTEAQAAAQAKLYADSAFGRYWQIRRQAERNAGTQEAKLVTVGDERVCFPAWTLVETSQGAVPIQFLKPGMRVLTRVGFCSVAAVSQRTYTGAMTTVDADGMSVTATSDHPFWTLEQGWLACGRIERGYSVQTLGKKLVKVGSVHHFFLGNANDAPTVGLKVGILSAIPIGVSMPVDAISFKRHACISQQEVNAVSANPNFLLKRNVQVDKGFPYSSLERRFRSGTSITGKTAELLACGAGNSSKSLATRRTLNVDRRTPALFRAVVPIEIRFSAKNLAASLAGDVLGGCGTAVTTANGVPIGNGCANGKLVPAHWTRLGDHSRGTGNGTALKTAILAPSVDLLSSERLPALLTNLIGQYSDTIVAGLRAVFFALPSRVEFLSASLANLFHCNSFGDSRLLTQLCHVGCNSAIWVYDIQVDEHPEFYANGVLVHNCPVCGPNHTIAIPKAQRTWPSGASVPAHVNCRCSVIEETALTMQTALPREERYQWSADAYAQYQADQ